MSDFEFTSHADEVLEALEKARANALTAIGMTAETYAKRETPVDTGRARNSITYATSEYSGVGSYTDNNGNSYSDATARAQAEEDAVYIGSNVEYFPYIELGARNIEAHRMLRRAATEHTDEYKELAKQAFENA